MSSIHPDLIERYQLTLERDPKSQVFAPLSEAYRKMGLLDEAFRISSRGVQFHPHFAGGHIALANIFMDRQQWENAKETLEKAVALSPENILAYQQLAEAYLHLKKAKEALKAFKMVLFFSPNNKRAAIAVQKLESLTADEYDDDLFAMDRLQPLKEPLERIQPQSSTTEEKKRALENRLAVIDAYSARGDFENSFKLLEALEMEHPGHLEVQKRKKTISLRLKEPEVKAAGPIPSRADLIRDEKIKFLEDLKKKIEAEVRMRDVHSP